jgi:sugar phosphate isomerase/epimerase
MMKRLLEESKVDGFEFVLLPEWDSENPPLTPTSSPWECEKHSLKEIVKALEVKDLPILSVHANRDIGNYLCSEEIAKVKKGMRLIQESLDFAEKVGSKICVFHFWDTFKEVFDIQNLEKLYLKFQNAFPNVEMSIENVPTKYMSRTPFQIIQNFRHKTLDFKWASLFNEFDSFISILGQIDNVHIQGKHQQGTVVSSVGSLDYKKAIERIKDAGYSGVFTIELEGRATCDEAIECINKLKEM